MAIGGCSSLLLLSLVWVIDPVSSQGTDLGGGIVTRTDVERYADLALDVRDIREQLEADRPEASLSLYLNGRNSEIQPGIKLTLQGLSQELADLQTSRRTPPYIYHLYGLSDRDTTKLQDHALYADSFVRASISSSSSVAGEAVVVLNMWMYAVHSLFHGIDTCEKLSLADNPSALNLGGGGMDEFIAVWIGQDQTPATSDGYSMYTVTQDAAELFNKNDPEAPPNTNLKLLYNEGASALSSPDACSRNNADTVPRLWSVAQRMISQSYIPLVQKLIDALVSGNNAAVRLYALAVVPQISQCRPSIYKRLKVALLDGTSTIFRYQDIIRELQLVYDCLGFTCADVGAYKINALAQCAERPDNLPLAEYTPSTPVHAIASIDMDVLQIRILTLVEAYSFAKLQYNYGRNSPHSRRNQKEPYQLRTLADFATSSNRRAADPLYSDFASYFNQPNYADIVIVDTLDGNGKWGTSSVAQKAEVVSVTCAFQVVLMQALTELGGAMTACNNKQPTGSNGVHQWDEVAAYLIGSMEGTAAGGSIDLEDGQLLWNLANRHAFQFQTLNDEGFSRIDSQLEDLLFAGKAELNALDCENLGKTIVKIQQLVFLPIVQSTLRYAIINEDLPPSSLNNGEVAAGETYALSVLPVAKKYDATAAQLIYNNMVRRDGVRLVEGGSQVVADAFYQALDGFGYNCVLVGATEQVDACSLAGGIKKAEESGAINRFSSALAVVVAVCAVWLL